MSQKPQTQNSKNLSICPCSCFLLLNEYHHPSNVTNQQLGKGVVVVLCPVPLHHLLLNSVDRSICIQPHHHFLSSLLTSSNWPSCLCLWLLQSLTHAIANNIFLKDKSSQNTLLQSFSVFPWLSVWTQTLWQSSLSPSWLDLSPPRVLFTYLSLCSQMQTHWPALQFPECAAIVPSLWIVHACPAMIFQFSLLLQVFEAQFKYLFQQISISHNS